MQNMYAYASQSQSSLAAGSDLSNSKLKLVDQCGTKELINKQHERVLGKSVKKRDISQISDQID